MKKGNRESYDVKLYKPNSNVKGSFWCSCPDHKFNSSKKQMVCKHVCFVVCRVGKIIDHEFFNTKQLSEEQYAILLSRLDNTHHLLRDLTISRPTQENKLLIFKQREKVISEEDMCPICYDALDADCDQTLSCPTCLNYVHKGCIEVWMERNVSCVYCRSDVWKHYKN
jgi:uncharacterized Zn finger protein